MNAGSKFPPDLTVICHCRQQFLQNDLNLASKDLGIHPHIGFDQNLLFILPIAVPHGFAGMSADPILYPARKSYSVGVSLPIMTQIIGYICDPIFLVESALPLHQSMAHLVFGRPRFLTFAGRELCCRLFLFGFYHPAKRGDARDIKKVSPLSAAVATRLLASVVSRCRS